LTEVLKVDNGQVVVLDWCSSPEVIDERV
jgi:hypothetical protein